MPPAAAPTAEVRTLALADARLTISPVAVQQTGRLMACSWSNATRTP
jgi:hypothetical protein